MPKTTKLIALCACIMLIIQAGCETTSSTTPPPVPASKLNQPIDSRSIDILVADAAEYLSRTLPNTTEAKQFKYRKVLGITAPLVKGFKEADRFDLVLDQLRDRLTQNTSINQLFRVVSMSTTEANSIVTSLNDNHIDDAANPYGLDSPSLKKYDPRDLYVLSGKFSQINDDGNIKTLYLTIEILHPISRTSILSHQLNRAFAWDNNLQGWKLLN